MTIALPDRVHVQSENMVCRFKTRTVPGRRADSEEPLRVQGRSLEVASCDIQFFIPSGIRLPLNLDSPA